MPKMNGTHAAVYRAMLRVDELYPLPKSLCEIHDRMAHFMQNYGPREFSGATYALVLVVWEMNCPDDVISSDSVRPVADLNERAKAVEKQKLQAGVDVVLSAADGDFVSVLAADRDDENAAESPEEPDAPQSKWAAVEAGAEVLVTKEARPPVAGKFVGIKDDSGKLLVRLENMPTGSRQFDESEVALVETSPVS